MRDISKNTEIRAYAALNAVFLKDVGQRNGLSQVEMSQKLRYELSDEEKEGLYNTIDEIVKERGDEPKRLQRI